MNLVKQQLLRIPSWKDADHARSRTHTRTLSLAQQERERLASLLKGSKLQ